MNYTYRLDIRGYHRRMSARLWRGDCRRKPPRSYRSARRSRPSNSGRRASPGDRTRPDAVVVAAAKVGGILVNDRYPADFLPDNLLIETNVIHATLRCDVDRLGSWAHPASTRSWRHSRSRNTRFSRAPWNPPTSGTLSPRSPVSNCVRPTAASTVLTMFGNAL